MVVALICCGLPYAYTRWSVREEQRQADEEITEYLRLVQAGDRGRSHAMLCGGDDMTTIQLNGTYKLDWNAVRVDSFTIIGARDWSSVVDGHGRAYRVRLTFTDGSTGISDLVVEVMANEPCIGTEIPF